MRHCPLCGNRTDPKVHIKDFGKTPKEIVKLQKEFLINAMKSMYISQPEVEWIGTSLVSMLEEVQDELDKAGGKEEVSNRETL